MQVDNDFKVLTTPRMVFAGFEQTIWCTSCKKEKLVDPNRPDCVTCSNFRSRKQKDYHAGKAEAAAELEDWRKSTHQALVSGISSGAGIGSDGAAAELLYSVVSISVTLVNEDTCTIEKMKSKNII